MIRYIWVTGQFHGMHHYPQAPEEVAYLRTSHRHIFNWKVGISVTEQDRELEFHMVQKAITDTLQARLRWDDVGSCEHICNLLHLIVHKLYPLRKYQIDVNEDNECGSTLIT